VDKKGYFGERMETQPAAGRYIEAKLGKVADLLLFDDMNQVEMVPNYDEKVMEPVALLPKLPIMLLNGAEGIGTGFSSVIPSFNHKEIIKSMINFLQTGKPKKMKPWFRYYNGTVEVDNSGRIMTKMELKQIKDKIFITELPKGYDAKKIYRHLNKFIDEDYIKDFIDSSVDNNIMIELIFKRGQVPSLAEVEKKMGASASIVPNYTLISERGVKVLDRAEDIIEIFTAQRLKVVKRRYELLVEDYRARILKNNEIIRFIREKHYAQAEKKANRKDFVDYLSSKKFTYSDYLADMAIYRMTKEEVGKRELLIKEESKELKEFEKIAKSDKLVQEKLVAELSDVDEKLSKIMAEKEKQKVDTFSKKKTKKVN
jgi:DNA gyrase subunit A